MGAAGAQTGSDDDFDSMNLEVDGETSTSSYTDLASDTETDATISVSVEQQEIILSLLQIQMPPATSMLVAACCILFVSSIGATICAFNLLIFTTACCRRRFKPISRRSVDLENRSQRASLNLMTTAAPLAFIRSSNSSCPVNSAPLDNRLSALSDLRTLSLSKPHPLQLASRKASHRLVVSLMVGDLSMCALGILKSIPLATPGGVLSISPTAQSCAQVLVDQCRVSVIIHNLLVLTALCCDLCLAIRRPNIHRQVFSVQRTLRLVIVSWMIAFLAGYSSFCIESLFKLPSSRACSGSAVNRDRNHNQSGADSSDSPPSTIIKTITKTSASTSAAPIGDTVWSTSASLCERVFCSQFDAEFIVLGIMAISIALQCAMYSVIFATLSSMRKQPAARNVEAQQRYRKALQSLFFMFISFCVCVLPYSASKIVWLGFDGASSTRIGAREAIVVANFYSFGLLCLSALLNNLTFARRLRSVHASVAYRICDRALRQVPTFCICRTHFKHDRSRNQHEDCCNTDAG